MVSSRILSLAAALVAAAVSSTAAPTLKPGTTIIERQFNETLSKRDTGFNYGGTDIRGVNLGGWLLLGRSQLPLPEDSSLTLQDTIPRALHYALAIRKPGREYRGRIHLFPEPGPGSCSERSPESLVSTEHSFLLQDRATD